MSEKLPAGSEKNGSQKRINIWFPVAIIALLLLAALAVYVFLLLNKEEKNVEFSAYQVKAADSGDVSVTAYSDLVSMELMIRTLNTPYVCICGNCIVSDPSVISREGQTWMINGIPEDRGILSNLTLFGDKEIVQLSLINENLTHLSGLENMQDLEYLDLSGTPIEDLGPVAALKKLQVLRIEKLPLTTDLSVLTGAPSLQQVIVSYDMVGMVKPLTEADIEVIVKKE